MVDPLTGRPGASFKQPWLQRWMRFAHILGNVWAWILLTLFYVVVITPIGFMVRLTSDRLRLRPRRSSWQPLASQHDRLEKAPLQS